MDGRRGLAKALLRGVGLAVCEAEVTGTGA